MYEEINDSMIIVKGDVDEIYLGLFVSQIFMWEFVRREQSIDYEVRFQFYFLLSIDLQVSQYSVLVFLLGNWGSESIYIVEVSKIRV